MKKLTIILLPFAVCSLLLVGAQVAGAASHVNSTKTVRVVMKDPGCHWFSVGGKLKTRLSVSGPIALANFDEAALKIVSPNGTRFDAVGKSIKLTRGSYRITMVHQHPDDNTLKLIIS
jgi:hypothetical protein